MDIGKLHNQTSVIVNVSVNVTEMSLTPEARNSIWILSAANRLSWPIEKHHPPAPLVAHLSHKITKPHSKPPKATSDKSPTTPTKQAFATNHQQPPRPPYPLAKVGAAGSTPVSRFFYACPTLPDISSPP
jgi:hypothetical protein